MEIAELTAYCLEKPGAWVESPWEHVHPVVKVGPGETAKTFAFPGAATLGVKAYIGRHGGNALCHAGGIPAEELLEAVDDSYRLVVSTMPTSLRPLP